MVFFSISIGIGNTLLKQYCYQYWQYFLKEDIGIGVAISFISIVNNPEFYNVFV